MARLKVVFSLLLTVLMLVGCPRSLVTPPSVSPIAAQPAPLSDPAHAREDSGASTAATPIRGRLEVPTGMRISATTGDLLASASVTLMEHGGYAITSGLTNGTGAFDLAPVGFIPASGSTYVLEIAKSLNSAAPGKVMARFRTILKWVGNGWHSINSTTLNAPIVINPLTTAVALESALDPVNVAPENTAGKVNAGVTPAVLAATPVYTNHPNTQIQDLATNLVSYLTGDLDPTAQVSGLVPAISSLSMEGGNPGEVMTVYGTGFSPVLGANTVLFSTATASVFVATPNLLIVGIPTGAVTGNVTVKTQFGTSPGVSFTVGKVTITIDPNGYLGAWHIPGGTVTWQYYKRQVSLALNRTYWMQISTRKSYKFTIDAAGVLTLDPETEGDTFATVGVNLLTFKTVDVTIDVGTMTYRPWYVWGANEWQEGTRTVKLIPNNSNRVYIYGSDYIPFDLDTTNGVTVTNSSTAATGTPGKITFNNATVTVNAGTSDRSWIINGGREWYYGNGSVVLPRHMTYQLGISGLGWRNFKLSETGVVQLSDTSLTVAGNTISYATVNVAINTNGYGSTGIGITRYRGWYQLLGQRYEGNQTVTLVKGVTYWLLIEGTTAWISFTVDASGTVTSNYPVSMTGGAAVSGVAPLTFNVANLTVNRNGYPGDWVINGIGGRSAQETADPPVPLVKGLSYYFLPEGDWTFSTLFSIGSSGAVTVNKSDSFTGGTTSLTYLVQNVTVDPKTWYNPWRIYGLPTELGKKTLPLIVNRTYHFWPKYDYSAWRSDFKVDAAGAVTTGELHTGGTGTLTLKVVTTTVTVSNNTTTPSFTGRRAWYMWGACDYAYGNTATVSIIPGLQYRFYQIDYTQPVLISTNPTTGAASPSIFSIDGTASFTLSP